MLNINPSHIVAGHILFRCRHSMRLSRLIIIMPSVYEDLYPSVARLSSEVRPSWDYLGLFTSYFHFKDSIGLSHCQGRPSSLTLRFEKYGVRPNNITIDCQRNVEGTPLLLLDITITSCNFMSFME